eukprot:955830-Amphidinium_carterae.1
MGLPSPQLWKRKAGGAQLTSLNQVLSVHVYHAPSPSVALHEVCCSWWSCNHSAPYQKQGRALFAAVLHIVNARNLTSAIVLFLQHSAAVVRLQLR